VDLRVPDGVTRIEQYDINRELQSVTSHDYRDDDESIRFADFVRACKIQNLIIPASVEGIGNKAFSRVTIHGRIHFAHGSKLNYIGRRAFTEPAPVFSSFYNEKSSILSLDSITFPSQLRVIGEFAFRRTPTKSVKFTSPNIEISRFSFEGARNLESVKFTKHDDSAREIGASAFYNCPKIREITAHGVTRVERQAFDNPTHMDPPVIKSAVFLDCIHFGRNIFGKCKIQDLEVGGHPNLEETLARALYNTEVEKLIFNQSHGGSKDIPEIPHGVSYDEYLRRR